MQRTLKHRVIISLVAWLAGSIMVVLWSKHEDGYRFSLPSHGTKLGEVEEVAVYSADGDDVRGTYGLEYQCVELVNRALVQKLGFRNLAKTGNADSYFWEAKEKGLVAYPNGGSEPPRKWDALVFDDGNDDGSVGHVAVITSVDATSVTFVQQNFRSCEMYGLLCKYLWIDSLPLANSGDGWHIAQGRYPQPAAGWSRPQGDSKP